MEWWFRALNPHQGGGETEGLHHYGRGSGGGMARDVEVALSATTAGQTGGGGAASNRRRETKEEQVEWAAKGGWAGFRNENENENGVGLGCEGRLGRIQIGPLRKIENCFLNFCFKEIGFKSKGLNIFKPNLNWIQNRIKSNQVFGPFSNLKIWKLI
jgi:hypothetical protein